MARCSLFLCNHPLWRWQYTQWQDIDLGDLSFSQALPLPILVNMYLVCVVNCSVCFLCCFLTSCVDVDTSFNIYPHSTDTETEAQSTEVTGSTAHNWFKVTFMSQACPTPNSIYFPIPFMHLSQLTLCVTDLFWVFSYFIYKMEKSW